MDKNAILTSTSSIFWLCFHGVIFCVHVFYRSPLILVLKLPYYFREKMEVSSAEIEEAGQLNINSLSPTVPSCGNVESAMTVNNDGGDQTAAAVTANNDNNQMSVDDVKYLGLISQQEYEAQFFGFTPKSFSDGCK